MAVLLWIRKFLTNLTTNTKLDKSWKIFDSKEYILHKRMFMLAGFWFDQKFVFKSCILLFHIIVSGLVGPSQTKYIITHRNEFETLFTNIQFIMAHLFFIFMRIHGLFFIRKLKLLHNEIAIDWASTQDEGVRKILYTWALDTRRTTLNSLILGMMFVLTVYSTSIMPKILDYLNPLEEPRPYNFLVNLEFLAYPDSIYFLMNCMYIDIAVFVASVLILTIYNTLIVFSNHVSSKCCIIMYKFDKLNYSHVSRLKWDMKKCIEYHRQMMKFACDINDYFAPFVILTALTALTIITLTLFDMQINFDKLNKIAKLLPLLTLVLILMFAVSIYAERITIYTGEIYTACYCTKWYKFSHSCKTSLNFIQIGCMKPVHLNAYGVISFSMELFVKIVQTSFSYFAVICTLREE